MDNAVLYRMLKGQSIDIENLSADGKHKLEHPNTKTDLASICHKLLGLVVGKFHDHHTFLNLRVKVKVESDGARELYIENPNTLSVHRAVLISLVVDHGVGHAPQH